MSRFPSSTEIVAIRLLPAEKDALRRVAARTGTTVTEIVRNSALTIIKEELEREPLSNEKGPLDALG